MKEKETVRVQMNKDVIEEANRIFEKNDLTMEQAVKMLYEKFLLTGQLPFEYKA